MFKIDTFKSSKAAKALSSFSYFPDYTSPDQVFFILMMSSYVTLIILY